MSITGEWIEKLSELKRYQKEQAKKDNLESIFIQVFTDMGVPHKGLLHDFSSKAKSVQIRGNLVSEVNEENMGTVNDFITSIDLTKCTSFAYAVPGTERQEQLPDQNQQSACLPQS